ncbi:MAG: hypothetical protein AAF192_07235 [Pseudomonadota bacterium]
MSVAEIADDATAPAAVAAVYTDIRAVTGAAVVNLVWRRLAAEDAATLERVWARLRGPYASGRLDDLAAPLTPPMPKIALRPHLLASPETPRAVVAAYDANNRRNLTAFSALLGRGAESAPPARFTLPAEAASAPVPTLPPLADLPANLHARLHRLDRFANADGVGPLASLYRHLAPWPALLEAAEEALAPLHASGVLAQLRDETLRRARAAAAQLPDLALPPADRAVVEAVAGVLVDRTIPRMIPIGRLIGALIGLHIREGAFS